LKSTLKKKIIQVKKVKKLKPKIQLGFNRRYDPGHFSLKKDLELDSVQKKEWLQQI